jgi:hypothetical protein
MPIPETHIDPKRAWALLHGKTLLMLEDFCHLQQCELCHGWFEVYAEVVKVGVKIPICNSPSAPGRFTLVAKAFTF